MLGSGIIMLPTKLAQVGTISVLSWLVTAVGSLALAHMFARSGMYSRNRGGMGGYAAYRFGLTGYFMTNFSYALSLLVANVAIAVTAVSYAATMFGRHLSPGQVTAACIGLICCTGILNFGGSGWTGRISSVTVWGSILPVAFVGFFGWFWFDPNMYIAAWNPQHLPYLQAVSESISLTLWTFLGMESAAANMDAVENPQRDVPRATFFGTLFVAIIYIFSTNVMAGIVPNLDLLHSSAPFGLAFATMFNPTIGRIVMGSMVVACLGTLLAWQFTLSQVFKSSAQTGIFPQVFAKVTKRDVPLYGFIILLALQSLLALSAMDKDMFAQFEQLVNLAVVTNLVPYVLCSLSLKNILEKAHFTPEDALPNRLIAGVALCYSLYAISTTGIVSLTGAAIVLLVGYIVYRFTIARQPERVDIHQYSIED
ncbi:MAG: putrescine-ornithine antiporter [Veillonellaceae bacterium]|nr:putrescine-ornithine antiporter [Veillonellaceae bacterium]